MYIYISIKQTKDMKSTIKLTSKRTKKVFTVTYDFNGHYFLAEANATVSYREMNESFELGYTEKFNAQLRSDFAGTEFIVKGQQTNHGRYQWAEINGVKVSESVFSAIFSNGKDGAYKISSERIGLSEKLATEAADKAEERNNMINQMYQN